MRKKLIIDLKNLAQEILQLKDEIEIDLLRQKSQEIFEKLMVLDYLNKNNISPVEDKKSNLILDNDTPILKAENKKLYIEDKLNEDIALNLKNESDLNIHSLELKEIETKNKEDSQIKEKEIEEKSEDLEDIFVPTFNEIKEDLSQKEEFKDTITIEETERFFERKRIEKTQKRIITKRAERDSKQLSLHDKLLSNTIQIGLNDRIAFVNNLFNYSQVDFNKVLSTLQDFENKKEAFDFINYTVKSKYNWKGKEDLVERFLTIIERKYL